MRSLEASTTYSVPFATSVAPDALPVATAYADATSLGTMTVSAATGTNAYSVAVVLPANVTEGQIITVAIDWDVDAEAQSSARLMVGQVGLTELVANAIRTELATELARIDAAVSTRATAASITSIGQVASYNNTDASLRYITRGDAYDGTANAALTWDVTKDYTSGWTGTMTIRHRVTGASLMSATVTAASADQLTATLTTTNTAFALLVSDDEFGPHPYDVQMVNGSSEISAVPKGIAIISKDRSTA